MFVVKTLPHTRLQADSEGVKHITFADKTLFVDDETSDALVEYAGMLGAENTADTVRVKGIGGDGNVVEADFVLNSATNMMAESTNANVDPPSNDEAVTYMRAKIDQLRRGSSAHAEDGLNADLADLDDY